MYEHKMLTILPVIEKVVTQDNILRYSVISGDFNPIHTDEKFASTSPFGKRIAHGMMTLAYLSEMLNHAFGHRWVESGALKVRFKNPAYPGDRLKTWGKVVSRKVEPYSETIHCSVALLDANHNTEIITGRATVTIPIGQEKI